MKSLLVTWASVAEAAEVVKVVEAPEEDVVAANMVARHAAVLMIKKIEQLRSICEQLD